MNRIALLSDNPNYDCGIYLTVLFVVIFLGEHSKGALSVIKFFVIILLTFLVASSASRGALMMVVPILFFRIRNRRIKELCVVVSCLIVFWVIFLFLTRSYLLEVVPSEDASITNRFDVWKAALEISNDNRLRGVGDSFSLLFNSVYYPKNWLEARSEIFHNHAVSDFFTILAKKGWIAGFAYLVFMLSVSIQVLRREERDIQFYGNIILILFIGGLFSSISRYFPNFIILILASLFFLLSFKSVAKRGFYFSSFCGLVAVIFLPQRASTRRDGTGLHGQL